ncbi:hypothetical protein [Sphingobacterium sp. CZ-2]|uniref:hypothetical protein n=1 Tax=Sphingobacterium sp. CZ-2 TaxID=2557994 RepID=UPI000C0BE9F9|nr:hypothetical protein [Sphingobacterium sp. CZ-2]QBR13541.1 hypothetical protein E3D81_15695 [Sphingobacterium sp. CZ-2]
MKIGQRWFAHIACKGQIWVDRFKAFLAGSRKSDARSDTLLNKNRTYYGFISIGLPNRSPFRNSSFSRGNEGSIFRGLI